MYIIYSSCYIKLSFSKVRYPNKFKFFSVTNFSYNQIHHDYRDNRLRNRIAAPDEDIFSYDSLSDMWMSYFSPAHAHTLFYEHRNIKYSFFYNVISSVMLFYH